MDDSSYRLNFDLAIDRKNKIHHYSYRKSILKLVKLQSLVAKCCKIRKIQPCKFREFSILLYYVQKFAPLLSRKWCKFLHVIQEYTKFCKIWSAIFSAFYNISRPNFTNFKTLFLAVVMDFVLLAQITI